MPKCRPFSFLFCLTCFQLPRNVQESFTVQFPCPTPGGGLLALCVWGLGCSTSRLQLTKQNEDNDQPKRVFFWHNCPELRSLACLKRQSQQEPFPEWLSIYRNRFLADPICIPTSDLPGFFCKELHPRCSCELRKIQMISVFQGLLPFQPKATSHKRKAICALKKKKKKF